LERSRRWWRRPGDVAAEDVERAAGRRRRRYEPSVGAGWSGGSRPELTGARRRPVPRPLPPSLPPAAGVCPPVDRFGEWLATARIREIAGIAMSCARPRRAAVILRACCRRNRRTAKSAPPQQSFLFQSASRISLSHKAMARRRAGARRDASGRVSIDRQQGKTKSLQEEIDGWRAVLLSKRAFDAVRYTKGATGASARLLESRGQRSARLPGRRGRSDGWILRKRFTVVDGRAPGCAACCAACSARTISSP